MRRVPLLVVGTALVLLVVGFVAGYGVARSGDGASWHEGVGRVGAQLLTVDADDATYGVNGTVPSWIDARGRHHDSGWPDCLADLEGRRAHVRFAAQDVRIDGETRPTVVAVDCREVGAA